MANRKHGTGTSSSVVTVAIGSAAGAGANDLDAEVEVVSVAGDEPIYVTLDGTAPTVRGDDTYVVQAGGALRIADTVPLPASVKMISAAAFTYSLEVFPE